MNIYIDESGSINSHINRDFVIALVVPINKRRLDSVFGRFIKSNNEKLRSLDRKNRMFVNSKFNELKGSQFDKDMKKRFVQYFAKEKHFELYYIIIHNSSLSANFCSNTARAFNYVLKLAIQYFIENGYMQNDEDIYLLQIDERNERTETRYFLENYLNTELMTSGMINGIFHVKYFDSSNNKCIQIADVFSNLMYSHMITGAYHDEINLLKEKDILKFIFEFPL